MLDLYIRVGADTPKTAKPLCKTCATAATNAASYPAAASAAAAVSWRCPEAGSQGFDLAASVDVDVADPLAALQGLGYGTDPLAKQRASKAEQ